MNQITHFPTKKIQGDANPPDSPFSGKWIPPNSNPGFAPDRNRFLSDLIHIIYIYTFIRMNSNTKKKQYKRQFVITKEKIRKPSENKN
jgi:hypothetical protein